MHLLPLTGLEAYDALGVLDGLLHALCRERSIGYRSLVGEGLVELDDKVVAEVIGHTAAVARGVALDTALLGEDADVRPFVKGVDDHVRGVALGESEAKHRRTLGGSHLGHHVMIGQIDLVVVGQSHLTLVAEPAGPLLLVKLRLAGNGHQRKLAVVVDPRRGLVGLLETANLRSRIDILPSVAHLAGLRRPEVHTPRTGYGRIGVAGRELERRESTYQGVDQGGIVGGPKANPSAQCKRHRNDSVLHDTFYFYITSL